MTKVIVPKLGFYYHYKHDPKGTINNYAYEVLNIGYHTEIQGNEGMLVVYRPLYDAFVFKEGKRWDVRPLSMFMEEVTKDGKTFPRFTPITDEKVLERLREIRKEMYYD